MDIESSSFYLLPLMSTLSCFGIFWAFLCVIESWHYPCFIKWHSHLLKGPFRLTPSSFDVAFYSVTWCPVNICIFILHGINLHSSHVLWKYSLSRLHPSVRLELMGADRDVFLISSESIWPPCLCRSMLCQPNRDIREYVLAPQVFC